MKFTYIIQIDVEHVKGKFAPKGAIEYELTRQLESFDPYLNDVEHDGNEYMGTIVTLTSAVT